MSGATARLCEKRRSDVVVTLRDRSNSQLRLSPTPNAWTFNSVHWSVGTVVALGETVGAFGETAGADRPVSPAVEFLKLMPIDETPPDDVASGWPPCMRAMAATIDSPSPWLRSESLRAVSPR